MFLNAWKTHEKFIRNEAVSAWQAKSPLNLEWTRTISGNFCDRNNKYKTKKRVIRKRLLKLYESARIVVEILFGKIITDRGGVRTPSF